MIKETKNDSEKDKIISKLEKKVWYYQKRSFKWSGVCGWFLGYSVVSMILVNLKTLNDFIGSLLQVIILLFGGIFFWYLIEWNIRKKTK